MSRRLPGLRDKSLVWLELDLADLQSQRGLYAPGGDAVRFLQHMIAGVETEIAARKGAS